MLFFLTLYFYTYTFQWHPIKSVHWEAVKCWLSQWSPFLQNPVLQRHQPIQCLQTQTCKMIDRQRAFLIGLKLSDSFLLITGPCVDTETCVISQDTYFSDICQDHFMSDIPWKSVTAALIPGVKTTIGLIRPFLMASPETDVNTSGKQSPCVCVCVCNWNALSRSPGAVFALVGHAGGVEQGGDCGCPAGVITALSALLPAVSVRLGPSRAGLHLRRGPLLPLLSPLGPSVHRHPLVLRLHVCSG